MATRRALNNAATASGPRPVDVLFVVLPDTLLLDLGEVIPAKKTLPA